MRRCATSPRFDRIGEERLDVASRPVGLDAEDVGDVAGDLVSAGRAVEQRPQQRPGALDDVAAAGAVDGDDVALDSRPDHVRAGCAADRSRRQRASVCIGDRRCRLGHPLDPEALGNTCAIWCSTRATAAATVSSNEPSATSRPVTADTRPSSRTCWPTVSVRLGASGAAPSQIAPAVSIPTRSMAIVVPVAGATRNPRWLPSRARSRRARFIRAAGSTARPALGSAGSAYPLATSNASVPPTSDSGSPRLAHHLADLRTGQRTVRQPLDERPVERLVEAHRPARERDLTVRLVLGSRPDHRDGIDEPTMLLEPKRRQPSAEDVGPEHPVDAEVRQGLAQRHVGSRADQLPEVGRYGQADDRAGGVGPTDERALGGGKVVGDLAEHHRVERAAKELVGHVGGVVGADAVEVRLLVRPEGKRANAVVRELLDGRHGGTNGDIGPAAVARHVEPQRLLDRQEVGPAARHRVAHVGEPAGDETPADDLDDVAPVLRRDPAVDAVEGDHVDLTGPGVGRARQLLERGLLERAVREAGGRGVAAGRGRCAPG